MKRLLTAITLLSLLSVSCNVNYKKTPSGLLYRIISTDKKGAAIKPENFVKMYAEYELEREGAKDTVIISNFGKMPTYTGIDTSARGQFSFMELLPKARVGDSIVFIISVDTLKNRGLIPDYNELFTKGSKIIGKVKILEVFASEEAMIKNLEQEKQRLAAGEIKAMDEFMAKNKVNATKTPKGVYVEIIRQGTGPNADSGKLVSVKYTGKLMADPKKVFDSNIDSSFGHTEPFELVLGRGSVIPGWEDGLRYFAKGGKGRLYIPSAMAYGPQGSGPIPPFSNLIFDIEVLDVKDAPVVQGPQMQWQVDPPAQQQADTSRK